MKRDSKAQSGKVREEAEVGGSHRQQIVDLDFLKGLIEAVDDSGIDSLEISRGGTRIRVAKTPGTVQQTAASVSQPAPVQAAAPAAAPSIGLPESAAPAAAPAASNLIDVKSPMVGTFYRSPSPEAPAYVEVGSRVVRGQTLCVLEAMKLMNELESDVQGVVREICVGNAEPIEYGTVLFRIEPEA